MLYVGQVIIFKGGVFKGFVGVCRKNGESNGNQSSRKRYIGLHPCCRGRGFSVQGLGFP